MLDCKDYLFSANWNIEKCYLKNKKCQWRSSHTPRPPPFRWRRPGYDFISSFTWQIGIIERKNFNGYIVPDNIQGSWIEIH